jgi:hypothetical protein
VKSWFLAHRGKVDKAARDIGVDQFHANPVTDIETLESANDPAFGGWAGNADPVSLVRRAGHDGIKLRTDS